MIQNKNIDDGFKRDVALQSRPYKTVYLCYFSYYCGACATHERTEFSHVETDENMAKGWCESTGSKQIYDGESFGGAIYYYADPVYKEIKLFA